MARRQLLLAVILVSWGVTGLTTSRLVADVFGTAAQIASLIPLALASVWLGSRIGQAWGHDREGR